MKIIGSKRCPKCGTRPSWVRLFIKKWFTARWPCPICGTNLRFDPVRRWIAPVIFVLSIIMVNRFHSFLGFFYFFLALFVVLVISVPLIDDIIPAGDDRETETKETAEQGS